MEHLAIKTIPTLLQTVNSHHLGQASAGLTHPHPRPGIPFLLQLLLYDSQVRKKQKPVERVNSLGISFSVCFSWQGKEVFWALEGQEWNTASNRPSQLPTSLTSFFNIYQELSGFPFTKWSHQEFDICFLANLEITEAKASFLSYTDCTLPCEWTQ